MKHVDKYSIHRASENISKKNTYHHWYINQTILLSPKVTVRYSARWGLGCIVLALLEVVNKNHTVFGLFDARKRPNNIFPNGGLMLIYHGKK